MPEYPGSARRVLKATFVPVTLPTEPGRVGGAFQKYAFARQLNLQPGEVAQVFASMPTLGRGTTAQLKQTLASFEGTPLPTQLPSTNVFSSTSTTDLLAFGKALTDLRSKNLNDAAAAAPTAAAAATADSTGVDPQALALQLLNTGLVATNALTQSASATPIGMLNLERLEMTPAGIDRGELLATIPLAPMEQTAVVQKEWSVTTKEFTSIVTDSLENYSETGVTENDELAQATTSQTQHSNQFNVNTTVSGSVNFATIASANASVATGFQTQDSSSSSASDSIKHAVSTTKKASSRVKQEHKVTISTTTVTGSSESTTRTLTNPSPTDVMRVDYFSLMRKWHVGLYRYGLRLTYDIVIPEPGGTLREAYKQLADLQAQASAPFVFQLPYSSITVKTYQQLAAKYGAQVPGPPGAAGMLSVGGQQVTTINPNSPGDVAFWALPFNVPDNQWITEVQVTGYIGNNKQNYLFDVIGYKHEFNGGVEGQNIQPTTMAGFLVGGIGAQTITSAFRYANPATVTFFVHCEPTDAAWEQWQSAVWSALYNAAQSTYYANQQALQGQIQALQDKINSVDTLTLRREEHDEITKGVLQWLLGPGFDFMPDKVRQAFVGQGGSNFPNVDWGISFAGSELFPGTSVAARQQEWALVSMYEQMVRFVNDAIDWDNILYFLYSYFWDVPLAWDNIRNISHPDSTRQAFLRAGSARVVLTVRKGWEAAWVQFVEGGTFGQGALPQLHPYLTIAQEIQDYDNANYPGIAPANPGGTLPPDDSVYVATACSDTVGPSTTQVNLTVVSSTGFTVGTSVIIDSWDPSTYDPTTGKQGVQETQTVVAIPDATHITVKALKNAHDGSSTPFPVILAGEKGLLIAEWFEHTPNSGTDIAVSSDLSKTG